MSNNNDYDFGFTFSDEEETRPKADVPNTELKALEEKVDTLLNSQTSLIEDKYKAKLKEVENLILPLLYNLKKNPEKAYINWPNRATVIDKQIEKIIAITRG